jgi:hypothetical protein
MSTETKHTPGPWYFHANEYHDGNKTFWVGNGEYVVFDCSTYSCKEMFFPPNLANARLICAAPEMLEALEALLDFVNSIDTIRVMDQKGFLPTCIVNSKLAIAKAKGEQP